MPRGNNTVPAASSCLLLLLCSSSSTSHPRRGADLYSAAAADSLLLDTFPTSIDARRSFLRRHRHSLTTMPTRPSHDYVSIPGTPGLDLDDSFTSDGSSETLFDKPRLVAVQPVRPCTA